MSNIDQNNDANNANNDSNKNGNNPPSADNDIVAKLVQERIAEDLKPIKEKLDNAFKARDDALRRVAEFEEKERAAELKRLEEEGKHKEAYEMRLAEEKAKREFAEKRNIELTRDLEVKSILRNIDFRNEKASDMAYKEIVSNLVQNDQGVWVHRSGVSLKDFVKAYTDDDNNSFLLKPKASSGSGASTVRPNGSGGSQKKSVFEMSQDEVLKLASEGKLRNRN